MSLIIQLPETVERHLRKKAAQKGVTLENYVAQVLTAESSTVESGDSNKEYTENELLLRIQLDIDPGDLAEYYRLGALFQSGKITDEEHKKLLQLNDLIEIAHAERMKYVVALAKLRKMSLEEVMHELGINRHIA